MPIKGAIYIYVLTFFPKPFEGQPNPPLCGMISGRHHQNHRDNQHPLLSLLSLLSLHSLSQRTTTIFLFGLLALVFSSTFASAMAAQAPPQQQLFSSHLKLQALLDRVFALPLVKQRAIASIVGSCVADAATRPFHWLYDQQRLEAIVTEGAASGITDVAFWPTSCSPYYTIPTGENSCYNDLGFVMLQSLVTRLPSTLPPIPPPTAPPVLPTSPALHDASSCGGCYEYSEYESNLLQLLVQEARTRRHISVAPKSMHQQNAWKTASPLKGHGSRGV